MTPPDVLVARASVSGPLVHAARQPGLPSLLSNQCDTVSHREDGLPSKPATEYWLTREQAWLVITQSGTDKAIELTKGLIAAFHELNRAACADNSALRRRGSAQKERRRDHSRRRRYAAQT